MRDRAIRSMQGVFSARAAVALAALALGSAWTEPASACSMIAPESGLVGYPSDGDARVPVDVVPYYDPFRANVDGVTLANARFVLSSATGATVSLTAVSEHAQLILTPHSELEPDTAYTLEATLPARSGTMEIVDSIAFTTGSARAAAPSPPSGAFLQHYRLHQQSRDSCSQWAAGTCVAIPSGHVVVAKYIDEFGQEHPSQLWPQSTFINLSGIDQGTNYECIKLQTRAANGALSDAVTLCGRGAPRFEIVAESVECTAEGLGAENGAAVLATYEPSNDSGGCAIGSRARRAGNGYWLALASIVIGAFGRRRPPAARKS
jgi:hypothetical protein